ncbi:hypothetical protein C7382_102107 [Porphyromonas loveana]|uniref:Uncharacterized protein n=1 Tax=Porphyromonas loveana TaxID=1884669 RepID=A0A2U1FPE0_9PORP|nr:hypothetical protein C7382_102107 [Porphyromonas loveana]
MAPKKIYFGASFFDNIHVMKIITLLHVYLHMRICSDKGDMLRNDATTNECYA